ncbi:hypothetical protein DRJ72_14160, partial [Enterococcus faecalis]
KGKLLIGHWTSQEVFLTGIHVLLLSCGFGHDGQFNGLALSFWIFFCIAWESTRRGFSDFLLSWPTCASKFLMEDLVSFMKLKVALDRSETIFAKLDGFCSEFSVCY